MAGWWRCAGAAEGKGLEVRSAPGAPDRWEIAFDNDCSLWEMPASIRAWLDAGDAERFLITADVAAMHSAVSAPQAARRRLGGRGGGARPFPRISRDLGHPRYTSWANERHLP